MTQEEKQLLLKDLSARLPYGVMCYGVTRDMDEDDNYINKGVTGVLCELHSYKNLCCYGLVGLMNECNIESIKPYLRPMDSLTDEEEEEYEEVIRGSFEKQLEFYLRKHLDFRGLIPKGLALKALDGMYDK